MADRHKSKGNEMDEKLTGSSRFGLTVDEALAHLMTAEQISDNQERRQQYRKILNRVRSLAYHDGGDDERYSG
jgi:hypothetical protein